MDGEMMLEPGDKMLENGHKAHQREDNEDRNIPFAKAMRKFGIPATRVPFVVTNGKDKLLLVLDVTRPDDEVFSADNYLKTIDARRRSPKPGNRNDEIMARIAGQMGVIARVVVFEPDVETNPDAVVWCRPVFGTYWRKHRATFFFNVLQEFVTGKITDFYL